jgi:enoyl-CoA hydratase/carnithine racemase
MGDEPIIKSFVAGRQLFFLPWTQREACVGKIVDVENRDGVAILSIDNRPVNALSAAVRRGPLECVEVASRDPQVAAVVIACSGRTSVSGGDVREFGKAFEPLGLDSVLWVAAWKLP